MSGEEDGSCRVEMTELQQSLVTALTASGALGKIRAQLRLASLAIIRDDAATLDVIAPNRIPLPQLTVEQRIGLLIVDEFLQSLNLTLTQGIYAEEASIEAIRASQPAGFDKMPRAAPGQPVLQSLISAVLSGGGGGGGSGSNRSSVTAAAPNVEPPAVSDELADWTVPSGQKRALSPVVEAAAAPQRATTLSSSSANVAAGPTTSTGSTASKARGSSVPVEADYEPSVDYSDHSVTSSLDITAFDHVEVIKEKDAAPVAESTSDDDF